MSDRPDDIPQDVWDETDALVPGNVVSYNADSRRNWRAIVSRALMARHGASRDQGADYVLDRLAKALGLEEWQVVEGSEDWATDVAATMWRILIDAKVIDGDTLERVIPEVTQ